MFVLDQSPDMEYFNKNAYKLRECDNLLLP